MSVAVAFAGMRDVAEADGEGEGAVGVGDDGVRADAPVLFTARCPECQGRFELGADALMLAIGGSAKTTFYSFTCPGCGEAVRRPAGERIVELLVGGGVRTLRLR